MAAHWSSRLGARRGAMPPHRASRATLPEGTVRQGDFWHTPANVPHGVKTGGTGAVILDIFSPPREEYRKPGEGFGT